MTKLVVLICSGAYIAPEFIPEVGKIPPALLPIGNRRLYEHQVDFLSKLDCDIYLSLPEDYFLSSLDKKKLDRLRVNVVRVDSARTLGSSILYSWLAMGVNPEQLVILLGDTLFVDLDLSAFIEVSSLSIHNNVGIYYRAVVKSNCNKNDRFLESTLVNDESKVVSGLFSIYEPHILMQGIIKNNDDFINGLNHYNDISKIQVFNSGKWLDFGHLDSFFISRSEITTQRAFNKLKIYKKSLSKISYKKSKMLAEASWYKNLPLGIGVNTPKLLADYVEDGDHASYSLEYLYLLPLNDLYVFGDLPLATWEVILNECRELIVRFKEHTVVDASSINYDEMNSIFLDKAMKRLKSLKDTPIEKFINSKGFDLFGENGSVEHILYMANTHISSSSSKHLSIIHGDLCFSNILFDNRAKSIKVIDPRGIDSVGNITIYGDSRYDIAKLYHSVVGLYDFIIAGNYELRGNEILFDVPETVEELKYLFEEIFFKDLFIEEEIICINIMLFISMLPLHSDSLERQKAMFINALRFSKIMRLL